MGTDTRAYLNEPENYSKTREQLKDLMDTILKVKGDFSQVTDQALIQEQFQERISSVTASFNQAIYLLGEMYGYTLADDVIEKVEQ